MPYSRLELETFGCYRKGRMFIGFNLKGWQCRISRRPSPQW